MKKPVVGVLAFQGDVEEHHQVLRDLGIRSIDVRNLEDLSRVSSLIIPGGESTVIAKFLEETGVGKEIIRRSALRTISDRSPERNAARARKAEKLTHNTESRHLPAGDDQSLHIFGTCAGAIVLAKKVTGKNAPKTLGLIDVTIDRNAYGSQLESFEARLHVRGLSTKIHAFFIRAPKITAVGKGVQVLATHNGLPVLVQQGRVLIATFHPEIAGDRSLYTFFFA